MSDQKLEEVVESFLKVFPVIIKYFILLGDQISDSNYTYQDYQILYVIRDMVEVPISTVGNMLLISKSRMTALVDRLIDKKLIERFPDKKDRRIINIALTEKGKEFTFNHNKNLKLHISKKFSSLSDEELEQFLISIANFQNVMRKTNMESKKEIDNEFRI